jgi:hypothetical protein
MALAIRPLDSNADGEEVIDLIVDVSQRERTRSKRLQSSDAFQGILQLGNLVAGSRVAATTEDLEHVRGDAALAYRRSREEVVIDAGGHSGPAPPVLFLFLNLKCHF